MNDNASARIFSHRRRGRTSNQELQCQAQVEYAQDLATVQKLQHRADQYPERLQAAKMHALRALFEWKQHQADSLSSSLTIADYSHASDDTNDFGI